MTEEQVLEAYQREIDYWREKACAAEAQCAAIREYLYQNVLPALPTETCLCCSAGRRLLESNDAGAKMLAKVKRLEAFAEEIQRRQGWTLAGTRGWNDWVRDALVALDAKEAAG